MDVIRMSHKIIPRQIQYPKPTPASEIECRHQLCDRLYSIKTFVIKTKEMNPLKNFHTVLKFQPVLKFRSFRMLVHLINYAS